MPTDAFYQGSWIDSGTFVITEVAGTVVRGEQQADSVAAGFACQLSGVIGIDDGSRVDGRTLRTKNVYAFEEERTFLFKEIGSADSR